VLYSGLLEFGQSFVPGRQMSSLDLLANTLGVILGALLCRKLYDYSKNVT
jgi:VanZ family protein